MYPLFGVQQSEMTTVLLASLLVFVFTTVLTVAGVGAAFIIIPTFY